ncbi:MAG: enterochelin esterase [Blastocatellia bacterium]|nr:enterochelin esterase [Blastocatellia bacterium]
MTTRIFLVLALLSWFIFSNIQDESPKSLSEAIAANPRGADADKLAERIRAYFNEQAKKPVDLRAGADAVTDELAVVWAIEAPGAKTQPRVVSVDGTFSLPLVRIGSTDLYSAVADLPWGRAMRWHYEAGDQKFEDHNLEVYTTPPENRKMAGVPEGKVIKMPKWSSKIFEGTTRDWWIYVPAQYKPEEPACVMVFQDGQGPQRYMPVVFDNLIAKADMPVTIGIFISPGIKADGKPNRSFEYDTLSDRYARFLLEEMLPEVGKTYKLRQDAESRAIAGISSGGICAWTVAWERPNEFSKVLSWVGSFTNIASGPTLREGGHNYPALIRKTPKKPIRIFLQDGENDLDNIHGNWPLAAQQMAKSLAFAGYDYKFVFGNGFHSDKHGRAILPDALRWLWRKQ